MANKPIRILKAGTFTDVRGTKVTFTRPMLEEIATSYDAVSDPAPLVIGHPGLDAPAYGWVGKVELQGDELVAIPSEVLPAFAEANESGAYRKVSPQLYPPSSPANPKPGRWYLQHVGFLGGAAPAIKGLGTVSFAAAEDATVTVTIDQELQMSDTPDDREVAFAERETALTTREEELAARENAIALREQEAEQAARSAQHNENVAFAEGLITAAMLAPAAKDKVIALMDRLSGDAEVVSFGEGESDPLAAFKSLFDAAHPVIALGEHAPADKTVQQPTLVVSFAAPAGYTVDPAQAAIANRALELQAAESGLNYWDAINRARTELAQG